MENALCHFEMQVKDLEAAKAFYGGLFGWEFTEVMDGYNLIKAGDGLGGGIFQSDEPPADSPTHIYIEVADIEACLARATAAGATLDMPKHVISEEHGAIAFFRDPSGFKMGIWAPK